MTVALKMNNNIVAIIENKFKQEEIQSVLKQITSIQPYHVMADSEFNLNNTRMAILKLADGDLKKIKELTKVAKIHFRDVILWASEKN